VGSGVTRETPRSVIDTSVSRRREAYRAETGTLLA
jgi:hypothetical protein